MKPIDNVVSSTKNISSVVGQSRQCDTAEVRVYSFSTLHGTDQCMNEKLTTGDIFPAMSLTQVDGNKLSIPDRLEPGSYQVVVFFRGKF